MKHIIVICTIFTVVSNIANAQENLENKNPAPRTCFVTLKDDSIYEIQNYSLQTLSDKVSHQGDQVVKYNNNNRSKVILKQDYIFILIKSGIYQKVKFADIEKLTLTPIKNKWHKCEILLKSGNIIVGSYPPKGTKLDCNSYSFQVMKDDGEKITIEYKYLYKIEKVESDEEKWNVTYKNTSNRDTMVVPATNIEWVTKKSAIVSTLNKYGENEKIDFLEAYIIEDDKKTEQTNKINFIDIKSIEFHVGGKRDVELLDGTIIKCEFKNMIKYLYGNIDENLIVFTPVLWGNVKSIKFNQLSYN